MVTLSHRSASTHQQELSWLICSRARAVGRLVILRRVSLGFAAGIEPMGSRIVRIMQKLRTSHSRLPIELTARPGKR